MNPLERQLASWTPRQPSPRVKQRLFPAQSQPFGLAAAFTWAAAATACLLFTFIGLEQVNSGASFSGGKPLVAMVMSNPPSYAVLPACNSMVEENFFASTFEWTNGGGFPSSAHFMPLRLLTN